MKNAGRKRYILERGINLYWEPDIKEQNGVLTDEEILALAEKVDTFDFLDDKEEDIYTRFDGQKINFVINLENKGDAQ